MKRSGLVWSLGALLLTVAPALIFGQDDVLRAAAGDKYVISAKAGGVNHVSGSVTVARRDKRYGRLINGDSVEVGDRVATGADGRVELLLNPGSYVRLGANSEFEFVSTSLDDLSLRIYRGSALLEVFAGNDFRVFVQFPAGSVEIAETGVYRFDSSPVARFSVIKGRAVTKGVTAKVIKKGRVATFMGSVEVAKLDRNADDGLSAWSRSRAKELARASKGLQKDSLRSTLMQSFLGNRWDVFNSFGLWVYDPFWNGYCFLPFGAGWHSPYGYGFGHPLGWYGLPPVIWWVPTPHWPSGGNPTPPTSANNTDRRRTRTVPPFVRMQNDPAAGIRSPRIQADSIFDDASSMGPSITVPSPAISLPAARPDPTGAKP